MAITIVDEVLSEIERLSKADRAELFRRLGEIPRKKAEPKRAKTNGKKGYVSPDTIWVRDNSHRYRGLYVAIKDGKFIAAGRTIKEADQKAKALGFNEPLLHYVPAEDEVVWGGW